jgi:hypothetical protein
MRRCRSAVKRFGVRPQATFATPRRDSRPTFYCVVVSNSPADTRRGVRLELRLRARAGRPLASRFVLAHRSGECSPRQAGRGRAFGQIDERRAGPDRRQPNTCQTGGPACKPRLSSLLPIRWRTRQHSRSALTALGQLVTGHAIRTTANFGARLVRDCCAGRALPNCCMGARADTHEHHAGMTSTSTAQQRAPASFRAHFSARQGRNPADFSRVAELSRCWFSSVCGRTVTAMGWQRV